MILFQLDIIIIADLLLLFYTTFALLKTIGLYCTVPLNFLPYLLIMMFFFLKLDHEIISMSVLYKVVRFLEGMNFFLNVILTLTQIIQCAKDFDLFLQTVLNTDCTCGKSIYFESFPSVSTHGRNSTRHLWSQVRVEHVPDT